MSDAKADAAPMTRIEAMRALISWADSGETERALDAIELLALSDEDIESLFRRARRVVRIPFLGRVT